MFPVVHLCVCRATVPLSRTSVTPRAPWAQDARLQLKYDEDSDEDWGERARKKLERPFLQCLGLFFFISLAIRFSVH